MRKNYLFALTMALSFTTISSVAQETISIYDEPDLAAPFYEISSNGKFATGEYFGSVMVYDIENGKEYPFYEESNGGSRLNCVGNDGIAAGHLGLTLDGQAAFYDKGEWKTLPIPEGFSELGSTVRCMTADRSTLVGWALDGAMYQPCIWTLKDGEYTTQILPYPEKDMWGTKPNQVTCWGVSDDASVICGRYNDFTGFRWLPILWTKGENGYTAKILCEDIVINKDVENPGPQPQWEDWLGDREYTVELDNEFNQLVLKWNQQAEEYCSIDNKLHMDSKTISSNGKYLVFALGEKSYHFDLTTGVRTELPIQGALPTGVTDDNTVVFAGSLLPGSAGLIFPAGADKPFTITEYVKTNYGLEIEGPVGNPRISADGKTIVTFSTPDGVTYQNMLIRLEVPNSVESVQSEGTIRICNNRLEIAAAEGEVLISDLAGKTVYCEKVNDTFTDLSFLPKGLYVVKAIAGEETFVQKMAIK